MKTFFCKLIPPRSTFAQDISPVEAAAMREHAAYWRSKMAEGQVIAFGPVADPAGVYGIGIIEVSDEGQATSFMRGDPVSRAGLGFRYELFPMPQGVVHRSSTEQSH